MCLLGEISILLGSYKCCILAIGDCFTDSSLIHHSFRHNCVVLVEFLHIYMGHPGQTSFNFNHTLLYLVLAVADTRRSCCSVFQRKKHFVCRQKAAQIVLPPETNQ